MQVEKIKIKDLRLWDENSRFPEEYFDQNEKNLVDHFLSVPKYKIENFAKEIVENFDLIPSERIIVWQNELNEWIVMEGNRRICVYKILSDPTLITNEKKKYYFEILSKKIEMNKDYEIECITATREEANRYLTIKHEHSNNEVSWGSTEIANHRKRFGRAKQQDHIKSEISKNIRELNNFPKELIEKVLGAGYITTLYRVLTGKAAADKFGFNLDKKGNLSVKDPTFLDKLKIIALDISQNKKYNEKIFSRLSQQEIGEYIGSIDKNRIEKINEEIKKLPTQQTLEGDKFIIPSQNESPSSPVPNLVKNNIREKRDRKYLIPTEFRLSINNFKVKKIYEELKKAELENVPYLISIAFRVFIELSMNCYLEKHLSLFNLKSDLKQKVLAVADHLEKKFSVPKKLTQGIQCAVKEKNGPLSPEILNAYLHDNKFSPTSSNLLSMWDNVEQFICKVWENIK
ncbi:MAG: hypothetical protein JXA68_07765 [Ignavibacteriales bacterium]|nr:hypothetical protein [Ignavibacteriales bacterium]